MTFFHKKRSVFSVLIPLLLYALVFQAPILSAGPAASVELPGTITPQVTFTNFPETEPNNDTSQANYVHASYFGQTPYNLLGTITGTRTDVDYYKLTTIISGEIQMVAEWGTPLAGQNLEQDLTIRLEDASGNTLQVSHLVHGIGYCYQSLSRIIPAGTYYIRIASNGASQYTGASYTASLYLSADCWVPTQPVPMGPTTGDILTDYTFSAHENIADCGAPMKTRFAWGDGNVTAWSLGYERTYNWSEPGVYQVKAQSSCSEHPFIVGGWSQPLNVTITVPDLELSTASGDAAKGSVSPGGIYPKGTEVSASALPVDGYRFYRWQEDALTVSRSNPYTFSLLRNRTLVAQFRDAIAARRLSGSNRYETAVSICRDGWPKGANTVILARGDNYADALAGVSLAYTINAPILLTHPTVLPAATKSEIERLTAEHIIILGGSAAVSAGVEDELEGMGLEVDRINGSSRYETAAMIAARMQAEGSAFDSVHLATGANFPDALAAASYAAMRGEPILLTTLNSLPASTAAALDSLNIQNICLVGGTGVISAAQETALNIDYTAYRISGSNRYATSVALAQYNDNGAQEYLIATGWDFPDAITGAVLAAQKGTGILLVLGTTETPPAVVQDFLVDNQVHTVTLLGGTAAISIALENWF